MGVEFYLKRAVLPGPRSVSLKMWDVGGGGVGAHGGGGRMLDKGTYIYSVRKIFGFFYILPSLSHTESRNLSHFYLLSGYPLPLWTPHVYIEKGGPSASGRGPWLGRLGF